MVEMERFYWLVPERLAGCSRPGGRTGDALLDVDLAELRREGVGAVLSLTESPLLADVCDRHGLVVHHVPIPDMHAPLPGEILQALAFIDQQHHDGRAVAVHCLMGQGRTGTILAAYRIREGMSADAAIAEVRAACSGAIESPPQVRALRLFAADRGWIL
jgi:atypical dual specificity phosphatase